MSTTILKDNDGAMFLVGALFGTLANSVATSNDEDLNDSQLIN